MTVKLKIELLDHRPVSTSLKHLLSNFYFPDTLLIFSNGQVTLNRIMVGLIFPHLKDSFPFTSMPDVTLVLDDWTLEQFWLEVSATLGEKEAKSQEYAGKTLERGIEASSITNIEYEEIEEYGNKTGTGNYDDDDHNDEEERFASGISLELDMLVDEEIKEIDTKNREIF